MRSLLFLFCLVPLEVQAQLFADFSTTLGDFSVELDYENAPKTVANFVILAEGSRPWLDLETGEVKVSTPFYDGITFHRVVDDFIIQAGSPNGQGTDGPGYNFPDEVDNGLVFDTPYLLAMANSGPNSNGSQFFITENTPRFLDGIHTIFGEVSTGSTVIDDIHATPVNADGVEETADDSRPTADVVINSLTIRRVGPEALAFNALAQELPVISEVAFSNLEISSDGRSLVTEQPNGTSLMLESSQNLEDWRQEAYLVDGGGLFNLRRLQEREFFRIPEATALITWPASAPAPANYFGKTLTFTVGATTIVVTINPMDSSALGTLSVNGDTVPLTEFREEIANPYGASLLVFSQGFVPFRFRLGADSVNGGRMSGTAFTTNPQSIGGPYTIAAP